LGDRSGNVGIGVRLSVDDEGGVRYSDLGVERGLSHAAPAPGEVRGPRLFELLYCEACEACVDLLVGGQRGTANGGRRETELLPATAELENLPERAAAEYYAFYDL